MEKNHWISGKKLDFAYTVNISFQILVQPNEMDSSIIVREYFIDGGNVVKKKRSTSAKD